MDTSSLSITSPLEAVDISSQPPKQISAAGHRLFWTLNGPIESAIQVAPSQWHEAGIVMEPYFQPGRSPSDGVDGASRWHPVSQESLMEPRATNVKVRIQCVDSWEELWVELHLDCPGTKNHKRPWARDTQLEVTASGAFLTVHEYVSAVHPWLMEMREKLLDILGKLDGNAPWPPETRLAVLYLGPGPLRIGREEKWVDWHRKRTVGVRSNASKSTGEERSHAVMEMMLARSAARARELQGLRHAEN